MSVTQPEELISTLRSISIQEHISFSQQAFITAQPQSNGALDQPGVSPTQLLSPHSPNHTRGIQSGISPIPDLGDTAESSGGA